MSLYSNLGLLNLGLPKPIWVTPSPLAKPRTWALLPRELKPLPVFSHWSPLSPGTTTISHNSKALCISTPGNPRQKKPASAPGGCPFPPAGPVLAPGRMFQGGWVCPSSGSWDESSVQEVKQALCFWRTHLAEEWEPTCGLEAHGGGCGGQDHLCGAEAADQDTSTSAPSPPWLVWQKGPMYQPQRLWVGPDKGEQEQPAWFTWDAHSWGEDGELWRTRSWIIHGLDPAPCSWHRAPKCLGISWVIGEIFLLMKWIWVGSKTVLLIPEKPSHD